MRNLFAIFLCLFSITLAVSGVALAATTDTASTSNAFGELRSITEICKLEDNSITIKKDEGLKIVSVVVPCFEKLLFGTAKEGVPKIMEDLSGAISAALALYLIFFGVKVSTGLTNEQRVKGELVIHALKVGFITWLVFLTGIVNLFDMVINIFYGFIQIVMAPVNIGECSVSAPETEQVWLAMDCLLSEFLGWGVPNAQSAEGWDGIPLIFGFVTDAVSAGFGGVLVASIIMMTLWSLVMSFFRVAFAYILAILGLVILFLISPITLPFMLFTPTKQFFDQWWKMIISFIIQPVVIFAFMAFMLALMSQIIQGEDGIKAQFAKVSGGNENIFARSTGDQSAILQVFTMKFAGTEQQSQESQKELIFSLISMLIVSYLLLAFAKFVPSIGLELSGSPITPNVGKSRAKGGFSPNWIK